MLNIMLEQDIILFKHNLIPRDGIIRDGLIPVLVLIPVVIGSINMIMMVSDSCVHITTLAWFSSEQ